MPEPGARVHREVAQQLEHRQRVQADAVRQVAGLGMAGQTGTAVDDHAAGAADTRPAAEIKLQARVLGLADHVQGDEERHAGMLFQVEGLHVRLGMGVQRIVAEYLKRQVASHVGLP